MKVRIKTAPREREMDGISLNALQPGMVREVSACIGTWLIVEGYAEPEMRRPPSEDISRQDRSPTRDRRKHEQTR